MRDAGITGALAAAPPTEPPAAVLAALEDDLNTPEALAELFGLVRAANRATDAGEKRALAESLRAGGWLLGLLAADPAVWFRGTAIPSGNRLVGDVPPRRAYVPDTTQQGIPVHLRAEAEDAEIDSLVARRDALRRERNFKEADRIRQELAARGIAIEDVAGGPARWRRTR